MESGETANEAGSYNAEVDITRLLDVPARVVFKAWIDSAQLAKWWGPEGFSNPVCEIDPRPGGLIQIDMQGPDGVVYPMSGKFTELAPQERIVFTSSALDRKGKPLFEVEISAEFMEKRGRTMIFLRARVLTTTGPGVPYLKGMRQGWLQSLERLENLLLARSRS